MTTTSIPRVPAQPQPSGTSKPPQPAASLAVAVVEGLIGRRPLHALRHLLSPQAFEQLAELRASGRYRRSTIGVARCQMPTERAAEIWISVSLAARWMVCVLRLDRRGTWACTDFRVLGA